MKTPGFNAERSLYRTGGHYRTGNGKTWSGSRADSHVLLQKNHGSELWLCHEWCRICWSWVGLPDDPFLQLACDQCNSSSCQNVLNPPPYISR